jgi:hypothetical protein
MGVVPLAESVPLYDAPTRSLGRLVVVMVGAVPLGVGLPPPPIVIVVFVKLSVVLLLNTLKVFPVTVYDHVGEPPLPRIVSVLFPLVVHVPVPRITHTPDEEPL